jgi:cytochrome bd-type quinol oxidase subunit 2
MLGKALPIVVWLVLLVYAIFDIWAAPRAEVRHLPKPFWFAVAILLPIVGALLWLFFGTARRGTSSPPRRGYGAHGPDDDPDFLRGL